MLACLAALFFSGTTSASISFTTTANTAITYTLTSADLTAYDPGGTFGVFAARRQE